MRGDSIWPESLCDPAVLLGDTLPPSSDALGEIGGAIQAMRSIVSLLAGERLPAAEEPVTGDSGFAPKSGVASALEAALASEDAGAVLGEIRSDDGSCGDAKGANEEAPLSLAAISGGSAAAAVCGDKAGGDHEHCTVAPLLGIATSISFSIASDCPASS